ncbi:hypothetical protein HYV72_02475 [Candidatus Uhrbacteria bacterium]|nr:hypothetical protein [Candidatus Uhrbacteria bacterium]
MFTPEGNPTTGVVWFDFAANTVDTIVGTTTWDNMFGCSGQYPFEMELISPSVESITNYVLGEGTWSLDVGPVASDCGEGLAGFSGLPESVDVSYEIDLDTGEPDLSHVYISTLNVGLERVPGTNNYVQITPGAELGLGVDADGDALLDYEDDPFTGSFEMEATSNSDMQGILYASSGASGGCGANALVNMSFVSP